MSASLVAAAAFGGIIIASTAIPIQAGADLAKQLQGLEKLGQPRRRQGKGSYDTNFWEQFSKRQTATKQQHKHHARRRR
jgi:hypothetical protein